jgi:uncharacterized protein YndB with AHSA1/START domain
MPATGRGSDAVMKNETSLALEGDLDIVIARTFNGPARIVFEAWTRPDLVARWWAPRSLGVAIVSCDADVRAGGYYRYVIRHRTGQPMAFSGAYREVTPPSRLVYTQVFEPTAGGAGPDDAGILITVTFRERDGTTDVVSRTECPTKDVRDAIIASGMETGMRMTMDQLEELVAELQNAGR